MTARRTALTIAALLFISIALWIWTHRGPSDGLAPLSVTHLGLRMDPLTHVTGFTINGRGATGLCAMFAVTNVSKDSAIWFETVAIQQKTDNGWQRTPTDPYRTPPNPNKPAWSGIDADGLWSPGYGCLFAVGWPPNLPTNAVWRIEIKCGRGPSKLAQFLSDKFDLDFLTKRSPEQIILTPEVHCTP